MVGLNKVFLMGNLTRDPELRYTPSGTAVVTIGLAVNREYRDKNGEIQKEALWIVRDIDVFNQDIITALRNAIERSPSVLFQDFLQGIITTITSGGELKPYFTMKAKEYMRYYGMEQKKFHEALAMLAESFIIVVVAFPLFLIVMMSLMVFVGGNPKATMQFFYIVIFFLIPLSQVGFIYAIMRITPEV